MMHERKIISYALYSRAILIAAQYLFNSIVPDHDAGVFLSPIHTEKHNTIDKLIHEILGGFLRWDAQYFMHIAHYGYTYENTMAFFPYYPFLTKLISTCLLTIFPIISFDSMLLLVFTAVNVVFFVLSALCLYKLTTLFFDRGFALKASILFCFNPASIFFTAPYTECLFSYLSFKSMLNSVLLYKKYSKPDAIISTSDIFLLLPICISTVVRSNGILNIGFLVYSLICIYLELSVVNISLKEWRNIVGFSLLGCILIFFCMIPFILYQIYCYYMFCKDFPTTFDENIINYAAKEKFILPGTFSQHNQSWCFKMLPLAYQYVQSHYWNVGFLKYYEFKEIPNFILAFPILVILLKDCIVYLVKNKPGNILDVFTFNTLTAYKKKTENSMYEVNIYVFVIHAFFLTLFSLLFTHVQISTRMLASSSPMLYWICAYNLKTMNLETNSLSNLFDVDKCSLKELAYKSYFFLYFIVGTFVFSNFLPWT